MSKAGFVALIGRPNVGKSTLLNRLVGQKISIVSDKPQTTRNRILGVLTRGDAQIIFVDTPGVHRPTYRMNKRMMNMVYSALKEVDLLIHMVDVTERYGKGEQYVIDLIKTAEKPALLVLNKVDLISKGKLLPLIDFFSHQHDYREIIPLSSTEGINVDVLLQKIIENLPESEFLFPSEYVTDQQQRFMIAEIIREQVLQMTREELPYSTAVQLDAVDENRRTEGFVSINASIIVEKENQKKIVVGHAGQMIKAIGTAARLELQKLLGVPKVFLGLNVRVVEHWRDREEILNEVGVS
ncbi:MAG: GTPase Era [Acidobacteria bacterium]|nr:GTPase Era [Acidobacteriota bacterium]